MGEHKFKKKARGSSSKRSRSFVTAIIVILVVGVVIGMDVMQEKSQSGLDNFVAERTKGNENAAIKIVEFLDFQCSHCKEGAQALKEAMTLHPDAIRLTLKYYPLGQLNSSMSAYYAECASNQGKFWEMHDKLFDTQDEWRTLLKVKPFLNNLASEIGLNQSELDACVESNKIKKIVTQDKTLGDSYSVRSTPTYFINGQMIVGVHSLKKALDEKL